jgi:hypothetical protein
MLLTLNKLVILPLILVAFNSDLLQSVRKLNQFVAQVTLSASSQLVM